MLKMLLQLIDSRRRYIRSVAPPSYSVISLCHMDGANGSSAALVDDTGLVWTNVGGSTLTTAVKQFGTAGLALNGSSYQRSAASAGFDVGNGEWTLEGFFYCTDFSPDGLIARTIFCLTDFALNDEIRIRVTAAGTMTFSVYTPSTGYVFEFTTSAVISLLTLYHVAMCRIAGNITLFFLNGVLVGSVTAAYTMPTTGNRFAVIGTIAPTSGYWKGVADEFRFTKGWGRYTAAFSPPVAPFVLD